VSAQRRNYEMMCVRACVLSELPAHDAVTVRAAEGGLLCSDVEEPLSGQWNGTQPLHRSRVRSQRVYTVRMYTRKRQLL
jgi:hypothetical protein